MRQIEAESIAPETSAEMDVRDPARLLAADPMSLIAAAELRPGDRIVWGPSDTETVLRVSTRDSGLLDALILTPRGTKYRLWIEKTCPVHVLDRPIDRAASIATLYRCARGALREARGLQDQAMGTRPGWAMAYFQRRRAMQRVASYRARIAELRGMSTGAAALSPRDVEALSGPATQEWVDSINKALTGGSWSRIVPEPLADRVADAFRARGWTVQITDRTNEFAMLGFSRAS